MRIILFLIFALVLSTSPVIGDTFSQNQLALRNQIIQFLNEEGYSTEFDSDGDISFNHDGTIFFVDIDTRDEAPMYYSLQVSYQYGKIIKRYMMPQIAVEINKYMAIKLTYSDDSFTLENQAYLYNVDQFRYTFFKAFQLLTSTTSEVIRMAEKMGESTSSPTSPSSTVKSQISLSDLFPVNGYSLNMTLGELKANGVDIEESSMGKKYTNQYNPLYDKDGDNIFEMIYIHIVPPAWQKKFDMEMSWSYNQWVSFFNNYQFNIITNNIRVNERNGMKYLYGTLSATNVYNITFTVFFDKNDRGSGDTKASKNTVDFFTVKISK